MVGWGLILSLFVTSAQAENCKNSMKLIFDGIHPARALAMQLGRNFQLVSIDHERLIEVVNELKKSDLKLNPPEWNFPPYLITEDPVQLANFFLVLNSLNFNFVDVQSGVPYKEGKDSGANLMTKKLSDAWTTIGNAEFLMNISTEFVREKLFSAETSISLVEARTRILREVGHFLYSQGPKGVLGWMEKLGTREAGPISAALATEMPSWRDPFFKRSQLFVAMLYGRFKNRSDNPIASTTINQLTVFADYRLPQTLRAMGIIKLIPSLDQALEAGEPVIPGSIFEMELRAASILISDQLLHEMRGSGKWGRLSLLEIDYLLWSIGRSLSKGVEMPGVIIRKTTEHRTLTTDY